MLAKCVASIVGCCVASKKAINLTPGTLVSPKKEDILLTPEHVEHALDVEKWIEWSMNQFGIVLRKTSDNSSLVIATANGVGICFVEEVLNCEG